VVHVIVTPDEVIEDAVTAEITGGATSFATVTPTPADVLVLPAASRATAARV
jgi:hypothetical protein